MTSIAEKLAAGLAKAGVKSDEIKDHGCYLSTGVPNVDHALTGNYTGGGFKSSRIVEIAGAPSTGKTLLAQHVAKEAQKAGGAAAFHDHEKTFMPSLYERFGGSIEDGVWTYKRPRSLEESFDKAIDWMSGVRKLEVLPFEAPLVCIFDSVAAMVPAELIDRDMSTARNMRERMSLPMTLSQELAPFNHFVEENNILAIFLNQIREKPGANGDPRYTPGGKSLDFYNAVCVYLGRSMVKDPKTNEITGQRVTFETKKNKTHRSHVKTKFEFRFMEDGTGYIDVVDSMLGHLIERGLIEQAGSWLVWEGKKIYRKVLARQLNENPEQSIKMLTEIAENG